MGWREIDCRVPVAPPAASATKPGHNPEPASLQSAPDRLGTTGFRDRSQPLLMRGKLIGRRFDHDQLKAITVDTSNTRIPAFQLLRRAI